MNEVARRLIGKFEAKTARVGVIGLGYVGLPLVKLFLEKGFRVVGFDIDPKKVSKLNRGRSYIRHISAAELKAFLAAKKFTATSDFRRLRDVDDPRESPSAKIVSLLQKAGARVSYNHPFVPRATGYREYPDMDLR